MFDYKKDDEFDIENLCKENNYKYTLNGNTIVIKDLLSVNKLRNSVYNSSTDFFKKFDSKEPLYFYCERELKNYLV